MSSSLPSSLPFPRCFTLSSPSSPHHFHSCLSSGRPDSTNCIQWPAESNAYQIEPNVGFFCIFSHCCVAMETGCQSRRRKCGNYWSHWGCWQLCYCAFSEVAQQNLCWMVSKMSEWWSITSSLTHCGGGVLRCRVLPRPWQCNLSE